MWAGGKGHRFPHTYREGPRAQGPRAQKEAQGLPWAPQGLPWRHAGVPECSWALQDLKKATGSSFGSWAQGPT